MEDATFYEAAGDPDGAENLPVTTGVSPAEGIIDMVVDETQFLEPAPEAEIPEV